MTNFSNSTSKTAQYQEEKFADETLIEDNKFANSSISAGKSFAVAGLSAATAEFLTFPIDTTKVHIQLKNNLIDAFKNNNNYCKYNYSTAYKANRKINVLNSVGVSKCRDTVRQIYLKNGIKGFYCGYKPALLRASLNNALSATFYKRVRSGMFGYNTRNCPLYIKCCSGFITGASTQILAAPTDLLKVRMQADSLLSFPRYNGLMDATIKIYIKHGFCAFYRGLLPSIARSGFGVAATFGTYDHCKAYILRVMKWKDNIKTHSTSSALSGFVAALISCPFDVVKTRYQSQSITNPLYKSPGQCFGTITKEEGMSVLYRGFFPMYLRLAPWQLSFFIVFEFLSDIIIGESF